MQSGFLIERQRIDAMLLALERDETPRRFRQRQPTQSIFTTISHAETELRKISFPGSANISRASSENSGASLTAHRNVAVSNSTLTAVRHETL